VPSSTLATDGGSNIFIGGAGNDTLGGARGVDRAVIIANNGGNPFNPAVLDVSGLTVENGVVYGTVVGPDGTDTLTLFRDIVTAPVGSPPPPPGAPSGIDILEIRNTNASGDATFYVLPGMSVPLVQGVAAPGDTIRILDATGAFDLRGGINSDVLNGGNGDDVIRASAGNDTIDGGTGTDTYDASDATAAVTVDLQAGTATGTSIGTDTLTGIENVIGSDFADTITGDDFDNVLQGGAGNDKIRGGAGNDTITGGSGVNVLRGNDGDDVITGGDEGDQLYGDAGNDSITGGAGVDDIRGGIGADTINGGAGNDTIHADLFDTIDGGADTDTAVFAAGTTKAQIEARASAITNVELIRIDPATAGNPATYVVLSGMSIQAAVDAASDGDTIIVAAGTFNEAVTVPRENLTILGANAGIAGGGTRGAETQIVGGVGHMLLQADGITIDGIEFVVSGDNRGIAPGGSAGAAIRNSVFTAGDSHASTRGIEGNVSGIPVALTVENNLFTTQFGLAGTAGMTDLVIQGNRFLTGTEAIGFGVGVTVTGGFTGNSVTVGTQLQNYTGSVITLDGSTTVGTTVFSGVELGTGRADLPGTPADNTFLPAPGNQLISGQTGTDTFDASGAPAGVTVNLSTGEARNGTFIGIDRLLSIENVIGSDFNDTITGDDFDNVLQGGAGNDKIRGGAGNDTITGGSGVNFLRGNDGDDVITGGDEGDQLFGDAGNDSITGGAGVDDIRGGIGNDTLNGGGGNDTILGGDGADTINGGDGDDTIIGGDGQDTMSGGAGADCFIFNAITDSTLAASDLILDFVYADDDRIDLSPIDANTTVAGDEAFTWIGVNTAFTAAGQLRAASGSAGTWLVEGNVNADSAADFRIIVTASTSPIADWFLL
jgi:Ca2+-binding RTX toxin-like protein